MLDYSKSHVETVSLIIKVISSSSRHHHDFRRDVTSRVVLTKTTDKLQRVLNSAARIVSNTRKFDRGLTHFRRSQLHRLDVVDRVRLRVCVQVFRCLHKMAPEYLSTYCQPVSGISGVVATCDRLTVRGHLDFPRVKLASY